VRFDDYWGDNESSDTGSGDRPMAEDGTHTGEILTAKFKRLAFMKSESNSDGMCLVMTVDVPRCQPVEAIVPVTMRGKIEAVARAAGGPVPSKGAEWDEEQLVGRTVTIETTQATSKGTGRQYVRVDRWHASPSKPLPAAKPAERKPAARTPLQKADAASASNDDIPF
jgi:hypothetical protein